MKSFIKIKILGHPWEVRFMERNLMHEGNNGTCWLLHSSIDICSDLTENETRFILTREITHAVLGISGRTFEKDMDQESVCETIAWHIDEIIAIRNQVMKERFG